MLLRSSRMYANKERIDTSLHSKLFTTKMSLPGIDTLRIDRVTSGTQYRDAPSIEPDQSELINHLISGLKARLNWVQDVRLPTTIFDRT